MLRTRITRSRWRRSEVPARRDRFRKLIQERLEPRLLLAANGGDTRHLRLAVTATEEYTDFFGSREAAQTAIETTVAGANKVFNRELNLQLDLIDNMDIIFGPGNSPDPFPTGGPGFVENQTLVDSEIGSDNYDIGIIFGGLAIGLADPASAGIDGRKAKAYTGFTPEEGGPAGANAIGNVLHEMGHQLAALHTFNGIIGTCAGAGQRNAATAFEPGSGSTISAYAGICGGDNLQEFGDPYYHAGSLDQIVGHLESLDAAGVGTKDVGVNSVPTVDAGPDYTIPAGTPFSIDVTGSDADDPSGDSLRYTVEQMDTGPAQTLAPFPGDNGVSPLFRSFPPAPAVGGEFTRVFPQLGDILTGTTTIGEYLPSESRELNFRATARDGDGGTNGDDVQLTVVDTGLPFAITSHDDPLVELTAGTTSTVTWDVAGTTGGGIDTSAVNIMLSTDGGDTFPHLLANTANDGSHSFTVPNLDTEEARIKVEGDGNIFFDISAADLTINSEPAVAGVTITNGVFVGEGGTFSPLTDTYTLALKTVPSSSVTVTVDAGPGLEVSTNGTTFAPSVGFSRTDTSSQTITVRAVEDGKSEGAQQIPISHAITASSDSAYPTDMVIAQVVVGVADNEQAPLIGVDLQPPGAATPHNWTGISPTLFAGDDIFSSLIREDGMTTGVSLTLDPEDFPSHAETDFQISSLTAPIHSPSLVNLGGAAHYVDFFESPFNVDAIWKGLDPGAKYNVYTFAMETFGETSPPDPVPFVINQTVTITGDGVSDPPPFVQDSHARTRQLLVNDEVGDDTRALESFAKTATANASGEITVSIVRDDGVDKNRIIISGLAIQPVSDVVISSPPGFSKSFSPDTIDVGGTSTLEFTIDNEANSVAATSLDFTDTLPAGVVIGAAPDVSTTCSGGTLTASSGSGVISYSGGTVAAAASCSIVVDVTSSTAGTHVNTSGDLTSSLGNSGMASDTLIVNAATPLLDFGDAPTAAQSGFAADYPTSLPDGARHTPSALFLGSTPDSEENGQPTTAADGDGADEDGVLFVTNAITTTASGTTAGLLVTASAAGKLDGWIDFTRDGDWVDAGEQLFATSVDLLAGPNLVSFPIPAGASVGDTYARFRVSSAGGLDPTGLADDGEVEDYRLTILDGDAPVPGVIDLVVGTVEVTADGTDVRMGHDGIEFFRVPRSSLASEAFLGTDGDDDLRLGNLTRTFAAPLPLIFDGAAGRDTVTLIDVDQTLDLTDTSLNQLANIEAIDIIGASFNALKLDGQSVIDVTDATHNLLVVHDENDTVDYAGDGWEVQNPIFVAGGQRHVLTNGDARVETINTLPFQNPLAPTDVDHKGDSTSLDALLILNYLGEFGMTLVDLPAPTSASELPEFYFDVNGNETASSLDSLIVMNFRAIQADGEQELFVVQAPLLIAPAARSADFKSNRNALEQPNPVFSVRDTTLKAFAWTRPLAAFASRPVESLQLMDDKTRVSSQDNLEVWQLALEELLSGLEVR